MLLNILFMISFILMFGEPIVMPLLGIIGMLICYIFDDGTRFYK